MVNILWANTTGTITNEGSGSLTSDHNLVTDPLFVNAAAADFRLQATSAARDTGVVIPGLPRAYLGSAPDIGALEYDPNQGSPLPAPVGMRFTD